MNPLYLFHTIHLILVSLPAIMLFVDSRFVSLMINKQMFVSNRAQFDAVCVRGVLKPRGRPRFTNRTKWIINCWFISIRYSSVRNSLIALMIHSHVAFYPTLDCLYLWSLSACIVGLHTSHRSWVTCTIFCLFVSIHYLIVHRTDRSIITVAGCLVYCYLFSVIIIF